MTVTKLYCDHCRMELDTMKDYYDVQLDLAKQFLNVDLCRDCMEELISTIEDYCNK